MSVSVMLAAGWAATVIAVVILGVVAIRRAYRNGFRAGESAEWMRREWPR